MPANCRYWRSGPDGGQAAAIAEGLERATGDILAWLNSDDLLLPGALDAVAAHLAANPRDDAVYSHRLFIDETGRVTGAWLLPPHSNRIIERRDLIPQETCFWRRRLFERAGNVDPNLSFAMDYELFVRYMRAGRLVRLDRFLGAFREHGVSKTQMAMSTTGRAEAAEVMRRHTIATSRLDWLLSGSVWALVRLRGFLYAHGIGRNRHGVPASSGYLIQELWDRELDRQASARHDIVPPSPSADSHKSA